MILKWLGLIEAGRIASSGGGLLGDATVWDSVADWAALGTISGPFRPGDFAPVIDLDPGSGLAKYNGTDWELYQALFSTKADLEAFSELVAPGASAIVGTGVETDPIYYSDGTTWFRTPDGIGYVWTITQAQAFSGADPSGIGAVKEGDFGIVSASGGPILLRYKVVDVAPLAGDGTLALWIPPAAYVGTNLEINAYALGTESDPQLVTQGFLVVESVPGPGTVSSVGGYIRLNAPSTAPVVTNSIAQLSLPTITGAKKFALLCEIRGTVSSVNAAGGLFQSSSETATQYALGQGAGVGTTVQQLFWTGSAWASAANIYTTRAGSSAWPASTPYFLIAETGTAISDLVTTRVDGAAYSSFRRNGDGATTASNFTLTPLAVGGNGVSAQIELKNFFSLVWD